MNEWLVEFNSWLENADKKTVAELNNLKQKERKEFFSYGLSFGTAGVRAKLGLGTNRLNKYTVTKYARAFAKYLRKNFDSDELKHKGVLIFHDNRNMSSEFSLLIAKILSWQGIRSVLGPNNELEPTPLLSYFISAHNYIGGINVTASHNPKEYNGLKFYNQFGSQIDDEAIKAIQKYYSKLSFFDFKETSQNVFYLDENFWEEYYKNVIKPRIKKMKTKQKILFSPQHGTSLPIAQKIFNDMNVDLFLVKSQITPDPNFTNTLNPNPGSPDAFKFAIKDAINRRISTIISIDPDGDRLGLMIKDKNSWIHLNGNDLSSIMLWYLIKTTKNSKLRNSFIIKSIVTSDQGKRMAEKHNIKFYEDLTGFRNLSNQAIKLIEEQRNKGIKEKNIMKPLFMYEESYGSIVDFSVRDKDAFQSLVLIITILDYLEQQRLTVSEILDLINKKYGYTKALQTSIEVSSMEEVEESLEKVVEIFSKDYVPVTNKLKVKVLENLEKPKVKGRAKAKGYKIWFSNGSWIVVRPSGTEPILKFYFDFYDLNQIEETFLENLFKDL